MKFFFFILLSFCLKFYGQDSTLYGDKKYKVNHFGNKAFIQLHPNDTTYIIAEEFPEFPGGISNMAKFIKGEIRYPNTAKKDSIHGKVIVRFIVLKSGYVDSVRVIQSVRQDIDNEAIRVIKKMPQWKPGMQNGKTVNVWFNLPLNL